MYVHLHNTFSRFLQHHSHLDTLSKGGGTKRFYFLTVLHPPPLLQGPDDTDRIRSGKKLLCRYVYITVFALKIQYQVNVRTLIRDPIKKTVKKFGDLVSLYSVLQCAPGSNVKVSRGTSRQVKRSFFAETSSGTYIERIIIFVLWLFDTRR